MAIVRHSDCSDSPRDWLDSRGRFIFGKHEGELVEDVAMDDPSYLRWIINSVESISDEDLDIIETQLRYNSR